jgi:hypothetical protein
LRIFVEYPHFEGKLQGETPKERLHLKPGELVYVKSKVEILKTLNSHCSNRGLSFGVEMLPYCGGKFKVLKRIEKIINEKTGKMMNLTNDCIVLENVTCRGIYHGFCPRNIYPYWREVWLRRVDDVERNPKQCPETMKLAEVEGQAQ